MMQTLDDSFLTDVFQKVPSLWHRLPLSWDRLGRTVKASRVDITLIDVYSIVSAHDNYLDEIQGWDTSVRDMSYRGLIVQETLRLSDASPKGIILPRSIRDFSFRDISVGDTLLRHRHCLFCMSSLLNHKSLIIVLHLVGLTNILCGTHHRMPE